MINPNLAIDEDHNLVEDLRGVPDNPRSVSTVTIERICWRLTDRIAGLLTALANADNVSMPTEIRRMVHQMESARFELHDALLTLRSFAPANKQPEHKLPFGTPLKFRAIFIGSEKIEPIQPSLPTTKLVKLGEYTEENPTDTQHVPLDQMLHRLK